MDKVNLIFVRSVYSFVFQSTFEKSEESALLGRVHEGMHAPLGIGRGLLVQRALLDLVQLQLGTGANLFQHNLAIFILCIGVVSIMILNY